MNIPILSGIYADVSPDFRTSYPINMVPVSKSTGVSEGYLRPADGIKEITPTGDAIEGKSRGAIYWNGKIYSMMGGSLVCIDENNVVTSIGSLSGTNRVRFTYGFDYLAFQANNNLYVLANTDGASIQTVNVGSSANKIKDVVWIDGYFMFTDGEFLVVTDLNDPTVVNPLQYGSAESDPDPIIALQTIRNEVYALNRYTIEIFSNRGGQGFPFARNPGAKIEKGCIGIHANCVFMQQIAFVGGGYNEALAIYLGLNGQTQKISSREIDLVLQEYSEDELATVFLQERIENGQSHLIVHLPRHTFVFDGTASQQFGRKVWFQFSTSVNGKGKWKADTLIRAYDKWYTFHTDTKQIGYLTRDNSQHWGATIGWQFGTMIIYNEARGLLFHRLELIGLTGSTIFGEKPVIWTQYSQDGVSWSTEKAINAGEWGDRRKRLVWFRQGKMSNRRMQRFRGTSDAHIAIAGLDARIEVLQR